MLVISTREFRDKQKSYLDQIDQGLEILIRRGKNKSYKIVAIEEDDTLMSKEEFFAKLDRSSEEARQGKVYSMLPGENGKDFIERLLCTE